MSTVAPGAWATAIGAVDTPGSKHSWETMEADNGLSYANELLTSATSMALGPDHQAPRCPTLPCYAKAVSHESSNTPPVPWFGPATLEGISPTQKALMKSGQVPCGVSPPSSVALRAEKPIGPIPGCAWQGGGSAECDAV